MELLVSLGAPREKLLVGVPLYGQSFTLALKSANTVNSPSTGPGQPGEYTKQPGMLAYYEICNRVKNHRWIVSKNDKASGVFAYKGDQWVGYEDIDTIREKAMYIKNHGFGGAVAWTIDLDDFTNQCCEGTFPLLRSLSSELGLIAEKPTKGDCTKPPAPSTPAPPQTTTGVDTGASSSESPWSSTTTQKTTTTPWWTQSTTNPTNKPSQSTMMTWWTSTTTTSTKKPVTTTPWWATSSTTDKPPTLPWWATSTTTTKKPSSTTTTTKKPSTTPVVWWTETPK